jgi:hypothetical protein
MEVGKMWRTGEEVVDEERGGEGGDLLVLANSWWPCDHCSIARVYTSGVVSLNVRVRGY